MTDGTVRGEPFQLASGGGTEGLVRGKLFDDVGDSHKRIAIVTHYRDRRELT
jgi:hypothetical protein